jgi:hypothetical protein
MSGPVRCGFRCWKWDQGAWDCGAVVVPGGDTCENHTPEAIKAQDARAAAKFAEERRRSIEAGLRGATDEELKAEILRRGCPFCAKVRK